MSETDVIIRGKVISRDNVAISITEFYKMIRTYLSKDKGYTDFNEKSYEEDVKNGLKSTKIKLEAKKKIDDYTQFKLEFTVNMKDYKVAVIKEKRLAKGNLNIEMDASLVNDYKEKWENDVFKKFLRGIYDKLIIGSHFSKLGNELKEEALDCADYIKDYLNMIKEK